MSQSRESEEAALADRLVNYSDAIVAVAFLGMSGLGVAIADPDIRCTIARAIPEVMTANLVNAILLTGLILVLRRWEMDLRKALPRPDKVEGYARWLHSARLAIVWVSLLFSVVLVRQSEGPDCVVSSEARAAVDYTVGFESVCARSIRPGRSPVG